MKKKVLTNRPYWYVKRFLDILFSLLLIIITFPLMVITVILLLINTGFPIFDIRFPREGLNRKPFYMLKFKTRIYDTGDMWGRKTRLSHVIDKFKLNELPQLFNVFVGQMSFVGPRAFICGEKLPDQKISDKRYMVRPGLISLSYVRYGAGASHKDKLTADVEYYDNFGFIEDLKVVFLTPVEIIKQFGAK